MTVNSLALNGNILNVIILPEICNKCINHSLMNKQKISIKRSWTAILPILFVAIFLTVFIGCNQELAIDNPYEEVNWEEFGRYKADLHAHTTHSDGYFSPHIIVDRYHDLGYRILALADHNRVTYPWQEFSSLEVSNRTYRRLEEGQLDDIPHEDSFVYEDRDPESLGMIAVQANEVSQHHHLGSLFNEHEDRDRKLEKVSETLEAIAEKGGLGMLYHPGSYNGTHHSRPYYPIDWYVEMFQQYDHLVGMEAYNNGWQHNPGNLHRWDSTLTRVMPDRPVWGFANDDFHGGTMGHSWNVFLLPELTREEVRKGIENGLSYFIYAPEGHDGPPPPEINAITADPRNGTIHIDASDYHYIEWISDGKSIHFGNKINLHDFPDVNSYVRAIVYQSQYASNQSRAVTLTQPFGIRR